MSRRGVAGPEGRPRPRDWCSQNSCIIQAPEESPESSGAGEFRVGERYASYWRTLWQVGAEGLWENLVTRVHFDMLVGISGSCLGFETEQTLPAFAVSQETLILLSEISI